MESDPQRRFEPPRNGNPPFQFSLRALLLGITLLALLMALVPILVLVGLCFAAGMIILLLSVELLDYFHRAFALFAAIVFSLIGTACVGLIAAVILGYVAGHDAQSKLITTIAFGSICLPCYVVAWLALDEFRGKNVETEKARGGR